MTSSVTPTLNTLLASLQSSNNELRVNAENAINTEYMKGGPGPQGELLKSLTERAVLGPAEGRAFAAVLLRRYAARQPPQGRQLERLFDVVGAPVRAQVRALLLQGLFEPGLTRDVRHKVADAIAEAAHRQDVSTEPWPELLEALARAVAHQLVDVRECAFRVLASAAEVIGSTPQEIHSATNALQTGFSDPEELVRIAATTTFTAMFEHLPKETWSLFKPLLPPLLSVMQPLRDNYKTLELAAVFESLIELASLAPKMFKPLFKEVIDFAVQVAQDKQMDESTRITAIEFATTFAEEAPNMCKAEPTYAETMVSSCLALLMEVGEGDDDAAEWNNEDLFDTQSPDESEEIYATGKSCLDRLALKLEGKVIVPCLFRYVPEMLKSGDWRQCHSALMALSNAAEGCRDVMLAELGQLLDLVLPHLNDPHSRVQWAACNALGQMSTDFADVLQRKYGPRVLPALIAKLTPESTFRVQAHAAAAIFNFSENARSEMMQPYLDNLLTSLLQLLQGPKRYVQEQILATIAIVADSASSQFIKYYDTLMPLLINVLKTDTSSEYRLLKAKSIECSTLIAMAVGKTKFEPHLEELVSLFANIQQSSSPDDPCQPYLAQAWARLCRIMGPAFYPCLPQVLPPLLAAAKSEARAQLIDEDELAAVESQEGWEVIQTTTGQLVSVHTAHFEDKATAIELLCVYACELGGDFAPYINEILTEVVLPGLAFVYYEPARFAACQLVPHLIESARQSSAANKSPASLPTEIWNSVLEKMLYLLTRGETVAMSAEIYSTISKCISTLGVGSVAPVAIDQIVEILMTAMKHLRERVAIRESDEGNDEFTEEIEDEDAEYHDELLFDNSTKLIDTLFKTMKQAFLPNFEKLAPLVGAFINSDSIDCREWALCAVNDLIEFSGAESWKYHELFGTKLIEALVDPSARIRQPAAYGIGMAAQHGGDNYAEAMIHSLETLFSIVTAPHTRSEENVFATENAVAAISKILRYHGFRLESSQLDMALTEWVKVLPITEDEECAQFCYLFLSDLIEQKHSCVVSQGAQVLNAVAATIAAHAISGKALDRLASVTREYFTSLNQEKAMELFNGLSPERKAVMQKVLE